MLFVFVINLNLNLAHKYQYNNPENDMRSERAFKQSKLEFLFSHSNLWLICCWKLINGKYTVVEELSRCSIHIILLKLASSSLRWRECSNCVGIGFFIFIIYWTMLTSLDTSCSQSFIAWIWLLLHGQMSKRKRRMLF